MLKIDFARAKAMRRAVAMWNDGPYGELSSKTAELDPLHAAYATTQNIVSMLSDEFAGMKAMAPLVTLIGDEDYLHVPSAPPMSPLTTSYFTCWAFFDACAGPAKETIGTITLHLAAVLGIDPELVRAIESMQQSRMGIYINCGVLGGLVVLEEIVGGERVRARSPTGYVGKKGDLWYARVLPPLVEGGREHVVFTTPYQLLAPPASEWRAFFSRVLPDPEVGYARYMKYGPDPGFWNEFIFESDVNHDKNVIYLRGIPDVPASMPHSGVSTDLSARAKPGSGVSKAAEFGSRQQCPPRARWDRSGRR